MCKIEVIAYRCGCESARPFKRCQRAQDALADQQKKRFIDCFLSKRKRQSVFNKSYAKEGYCRDIERVFFPANSLCHGHEAQYDGTQSFPRTNPLLHPNRGDGLVFVETNPYDGSGKMIPGGPAPPQRAYNPQQHPILSSSTTASRICHIPADPRSTSSNDRTARSSRSRTRKVYSSDSDRDSQTRNRQVLKEAEKLERDRSRSRFSNSQSVEDIRRRCIVRSQEQQQQQSIPVPDIPNSSTENHRQPLQPSSYFTPLPLDPSIVPRPLNIIKKKAVPNLANAASEPAASSESTYSHGHASTTRTSPSSRGTQPSSSTSYNAGLPPPNTPPQRPLPPTPHQPPQSRARSSSRARAQPQPQPQAPAPQPAGSYSSWKQCCSSGNTQNHTCYHTTSNRNTVLNTITHGAATHPRVTRRNPEPVMSNRNGGGGGESSRSSSGTRPPYSYELSLSASTSRHGQPQRSRGAAGRDGGPIRPPPSRVRHDGIR